MSDARLAAALDHYKARRFAQAEAAARALAAERPGHADALHLAGLATLMRGDPAAAAGLLAQAVAAAPARAVLHNDLGAARRVAGDLAAAADAFARAVALKPDYAEAWNNLGLTRRALGDLAGAAEALGRAVEIAPGFAPAHNALGTVRGALGDAAGALAAFARAVALQPDFAEALSNLGLALHGAGRGDEALAALERAVALKPLLADAQFNLGIVRQARGDFAGATAQWRQAVALDPANATAHSNLLMALHYDPRLSGEALCAEAARWGQRHGRAGARYADWPNPRDPERRLRVGYVSPDFREHSCAWFLKPLLAAHDRAGLDIVAYAEVPKPDAMTAALRAGVGLWRDTAGLGAREVAEQVRADGIDILVDLAGHSSGNRLDVFALKPAPVQATWLGYPGTTGLDAVDWRLTDGWADPPGSESHAVERLWRLPRGFHCWAPPADVPVPERRGRTGIVFGSFNNVQKVTEEVAAVWAEILRQVPEARLMLKAAWLSRPPAAARLADLLARAGIDPARLVLSGWIDAPAAHLAAYGGVDIALDPFPYNGTTTTLEALWMGVPVIALAGTRHSGRVGVSLLEQAGAAELIAATPDAYVAAAVALAHDPARRSDYHRRLRGRLERSALMDAPAFARDLESAFRAMWRRWCGAAPA